MHTQLNGSDCRGRSNEYEFTSLPMDMCYIYAQWQCYYPGKLSSTESFGYEFWDIWTSPMSLEQHYPKHTIGRCWLWFHCVDHCPLILWLRFYGQGSFLWDPFNPPITTLQKIIVIYREVFTFASFNILTPQNKLYSKTVIAT